MVVERAWAAIANFIVRRSRQQYSPGDVGISCCCPERCLVVHDYQQQYVLAIIQSALGSRKVRGDRGLRADQAEADDNYKSE